MCRITEGCDLREGGGGGGGGSSSDGEELLAFFYSIMYSNPFDDVR